MPIASLLVDHCGADIHIRDFRGLSCLHRAVLDQSDVKLLEFCIERGLGVDDPDYNGLTPLMMAVIARKIHFVRVLVEKGAGLLTSQTRGWTGLDIAIREKSDEAADFLFQVIRNQGYLSVIAKGRDVFHQTVLHRLVYREETFFQKYVAYFPAEVVQDLLLQHDIVGFSLLHHAVLAHNSVALGFILQHGADSNAEG